MSLDPDGCTFWYTNEYYATTGLNDLTRIGSFKLSSATDATPPDTVIDTGKAGDTTGDLLTFHNPVFDAADATRAGRDQGQCIRIVAGASWECTWTTFLPGGHITVEGPFFDTRDSVVAVTGGTGIYRNARGAMLLESRAGGTKFDFVFRLVP